MIKAVEEVILSNGHSDDETELTIPIVLIGHSKDFWNDEHIDNFLSTMRSFSIHKGGIQFSTFSNAAQKLSRIPETSAFNAKFDAIASKAIKSIEIQDNGMIV